MGRCEAKSVAESWVRGELIWVLKNLCAHESPKGKGQKISEMPNSETTRPGTSSQ